VCLLRAKKRPAKKSKYSEPFVDARGWNIEPPSLIWKCVAEEKNLLLLPLLLSAAATCGHLPDASSC
jgi:hypothetical protein